MMTNISRRVDKLIKEVSPSFEGYVVLYNDGSIERVNTFSEICDKITPECKDVRGKVSPKMRSIVMQLRRSQD